MTAVADLELLARQASGGDRAALESLVARLADDVYRLALRMLWHPQDAEDATQEILVRIVTGLGGFRGESSVRTWAHRVAANHLLTTRRRRAERPELGFDEFAADLANRLDTPYDTGGVDTGLLAEEVKLGCTHAMLLCLDREHRLAYVLGEIVGLNGPEAAQVLGIEPAAFRKRLERARSRIESFVRDHCGLVEPANACRCERRVGAALACGRVRRDRLLFASESRRIAEHPVRELETLRDAAAVYRSHPDYRAPEALATWLQEVLASGRLTVASGRQPPCDDPRSQPRLTAECQTRTLT